MGYARIQAKSGTQYGLEHSRKILKERELAFVYPDEIGKGNAKVVCGDGETIMCDLPFVMGDDAADMQVSHIDSGGISLFTESGEPLLTEDDEYLLIEEDYYETAEIVAGLRLSELFAIIRGQMNTKGDMYKSVYDPDGGEEQVAFKANVELSLSTLQTNLESSINTVETTLQTSINTVETTLQTSIDALETSVNSALTNGSVTKLGTANVGSGVKPIYLSSGSPTASSSTVGSGVVPIYMTGGTLTASTSNLGGTAHGIYLNGGTLTVLSANVGSNTNPVYMSSGTITACNTTVGSSTKPIYSASGVLTAFSDTIGGTAKPIYLNSGSLTACSSTVGGTTSPVYMNAGTITVCNAMVPTAGTTMTGQLIGYASTNYTTAQFRNVIEATSLPSSGNNGDICLIYS